MTGLLCLLLLAAFSWLLFRHLQLKKRLGDINDIAAELRAGNFNQRFRLPSQGRELKRLTGSLNSLLDLFERTFERARYLEEARKKMVSNISHDLRTPLTSLLGYVEALQHDQTLTAEEREQYLEIIATKGNKLGRLFQEFFELSKLEADDAPLKLQKVNLTEKVQDVLVTFYQEITQARLEPDLQLPERPLHAWGDPGHVERILNNLIANALRYGAAGGVIGLSLREEADKVWIEVWDRGAGIQPEDLPYIFERLYTGEASRNAKLQGNGLGLTITKQLIEKQQGRIFVTSVPHERTTFAFYLPKHV